MLFTSLYLPLAWKDFLLRMVAHTAWPWYPRFLMWIISHFLSFIFLEEKRAAMVQPLESFTHYAVRRSDWPWILTHSPWRTASILYTYNYIHIWQWLEFQTSHFKTIQFQHHLILMCVRIESNSVLSIRPKRVDQNKRYIKSSKFL